MDHQSGTRALGNLTLATVWLLILLVNPLMGQPPETNFSQLLSAEMLETFQRVCRYVEKHPAAEDVDSACQWIFRTALDYHFEDQAVPLATQYLQRPGTVKSVNKLAQQVVVLGQAQQGNMKAAQAKFQQYLKEQPAYTAEQNIDFVLQFAGAAQLQKQYAVATEIYGSTARRFTLNPQIRALCENKIAKLKLINEPAPPIAALDITGKRVDLANYRGKVLLIDFWATNCPPCLEALPHVKKLYEKYHPQGFEILGISLDVHQETVASFQRERRIPWQLMMLDSSRGSLRQPYKIRAIPSLYLVNREGKIVQFDLHGENLSQAVRQMLENSNSP